MRSTQVLAVLAVLAASVSSMSIGHVPSQLSHRRHAADVHESVIQARGARRAVPVDDMSNLARRNDAAPPRRKRGLNQRRCAPKTTPGLLETTSVVSTSSAAPKISAAPTSSAAPSTTPEPESTSSEAESTTSSKAAYTKTSSKTPTKTSTSAKPTATSNDDDSGSSSGDTYTGQATYYGTGLGSCGITNSDTDYIVAVSQLLYDGFEGGSANPNTNPICGKKIKASYQGKTVTVKVVDRCVACALRDLDFSPSAFDQLADQALGRLSGMTWKFE